jgi:hypothetical protein
MTLLSDRLLEPDVVDLDEAEAAAVLDANGGGFDSYAVVLAAYIYPRLRQAYGGK